MKKAVLILLCALACSAMSWAQQPDYTPQLKQLAGEIASFYVGTSDNTFESCEYDNSMIVFVINPQSKIGQYIQANLIEDKLVETLVAKMFSGNPQKGIQIMDFLMGTRTVFCFKIKAQGMDAYNESTVWPGDVKPLLEEMINK